MFRITLMVDTQTVRREHRGTHRQALELAEQMAGDGAEFFTRGHDQNREDGYIGSRGTAFVTKEATR